MNRAEQGEGKGEPHENGQSKVFDRVVQEALS